MRTPSGRPAGRHAAPSLGERIRRRLAGSSGAFRSGAARPGEAGGDRRGSVYISSARPIIIGGCGRSGTTLLRRIIDTHPDLCCGPESSLLLKVPPDVPRLAEGFGIPVATIEALRGESHSRAEFADRFLTEHARRSGARRWAEKTPLNIRRVDWIWEHFPEAQVVHVIRDGRDVVCSLREYPERRHIDGRDQAVPREATLEQLIDRWQTDVRGGMGHRSDPRYAEVRYEDLVAHPRATMERLFAFLGEPFDDALLAYDTRPDPTRAIMGDDTVTGQAAVGGTGRIHARSVERWRSGLTPDEQATFKRMAGPLLIELGYERDGEW